MRASKAPGMKCVPILSTAARVQVCADFTHRNREMERHCRQQKTVLDLLEPQPSGAL